MPRAASGFSLIELVVTLTVLSILIAVAAPALSSWIANESVRTMADGLVSGLHLAQAEASRRNRQVQFILTSSAPTGSGPWTASASGPNWVIVTVPIGTLTDPTTGSAEVAQLVQGADLGNVASNVVLSGPATLTFNSVGMISAGGAGGTYTISRTAADHPLDVTVSAAGQIRVCDTTKSIATSPEGC